VSTVRAAMRIVGSAILVLLLVPLINSSTLVLGGHSDIAAGDYWEYSGTTTMDALNMSVNVRLTLREEVTAESIVSVEGVPTAVLQCKVTTTMKSPVFSGRTTQTNVYLGSNFSLISTSSMMNSSLYAGGPYWLTYSEDDFSPPLDEYVGDDSLAVGERMFSNTTVTHTGWTYFNGENTTMPVTTSITNATLEVVAANVSVTVPAGSFSCYKIKVTENGSSGFNYYSDRVGNYIKMENPGSIELTKCWYSATNTRLDSSGQLTLQTTAIVIAAIGTFVIGTTIPVFLYIRRRRRDGTVAALPPEEPQPANLETPPPPKRAF
jgi:hypothetical protein